MTVGTRCDDHVPVQHRDGKPPWCALCGLTETGQVPVSLFERGGRRARPAEFDADDVDEGNRELAERFADQSGTTAGAEREIMDALDGGES